jgi:hypothetical protein
VHAVAVTSGVPVPTAFEQAAVLLRAVELLCQARCTTGAAFLALRATYPA